MEVDLLELRRSGRAVLLAGVLGVVVPLLLGSLAAMPFGYRGPEALAVGMLLTATSVSIAAQTMLELGVLRSREGVALLGAAIVDDVLVILVVSIALAVLTGGGGPAEIGVVFVRIAVYLVLFSLLGWLLIPWLLDTADKLPVSQGALAAAVVVALFFAWAAEVVGHIAVITGAFMAGVFAGRSEVHRRVFEGISALTYGFFVPIFFVNIGLHANVRDLRGSLLLFSIVLTLVAVISKVVGGGLGALAGGFNRSESMRIGVGMISRGEVTLIVASLFAMAAIMSEEVVTIAVLMVIATAVVTPPLLRRAFAGYGPAEVRIAARDDANSVGPPGSGTG